MHHKLFHSNPGFTIVELLVVVIVIGILATIVVLSGTTYIKNSADTTVQSNLQSAVTKFRNEKAKKGGYPTTQAGFDSLVNSNSDVSIILVASDNNDFCLNASSIKYSDLSYYMGVNDTKPTTTSCASQVASDDEGGGGGGEEGSLSASLQTVSCTAPTVSANVNITGTSGHTITLWAITTGMSTVTTVPFPVVVGSGGTVSAQFNAHYVSTYGADMRAQDGSLTQELHLCSAG